MKIEPLSLKPKPPHITWKTAIGFILLSFSPLPFGLGLILAGYDHALTLIGDPTRITPAHWSLIAYTFIICTVSMIGLWRRVVPNLWGVVIGMILGLVLAVIELLIVGFMGCFADLSKFNSR